MSRDAWRLIYERIAPRAGFPGEAFHLGFVPFALAQSMTGLAPWLLFTLHGPSHLRLVALTLLGVKITVGSLVSAFLITRFFPVLLHEKGVRARNLFGAACALEWSDIHGAKPIRWLLFTRYIRLFTSHGPLAIWIPLFLTRQSDFEAKVRQWAPPENPLRQAIEAENRRQRQ